MEVTLTNDDYQKISDAVVEKLLARKEDFSFSPAPVDDNKGQKIFGIRGVAKFLGCSPSKVQEMKNSGLLPFYSIGEHKVFAFEKEVVEALKCTKRR